MVKLLIALAVLFSYGLQFTVPIDIIWGLIKEKFSHKYEGISETALRMFIALFTSKLLSFPNNYNLRKLELISYKQILEKMTETIMNSKVNC